MFGFSKAERDGRRIERYIASYDGPLYITERARMMRQAQREALAQTGGAAGLSAIHAYESFLAADDQVTVLDTLEARYPVEFAHIGPEGWGEKLEAMNGNPEVLSGYVNGVAGYQAEEAAKSFLESGGHVVEMAPTVNYPHADLFIQTGEGAIPVQVKTLSDSSDFYQAVVHNDGIVSHYVVNSELYGSLEASGRLADYEAAGLTIWDGGYQNATLREEAETALLDGEPLGFGDGHVEALTGVPLVGSLFALYRSKQAFDQYRQSKLNTREFAGQVGGEVSGIMIRSTSMISGYAGAMMFGPPGMFAGVYLGGRVTSVWSSRFKNRLSFGKVMLVQEEAGRKYAEDAPFWVKQWAEEVLFEKTRVLKRRNKLADRSVEYRQPLSALLAVRGVSDQTRYLERLPFMVEEWWRSLEKQFVSLAGTKKEVALYRGEFLCHIHRTAWAYAPKIWMDWQKRYMQAARIAPHHPYRFNKPVEWLAEQAASEILRKEGFA